MLKCRKNGEFKIAQFTDLHIGYPNNEADERTLKDLKVCLNNLDADLIVLTGDQVWSSETDSSAKGYMEIIDLLNEVDIPVVATYGNHDSENGPVSRFQLRELENLLKNRVIPTNRQLVKERQSEEFDIYDFEGREIVKQIFVLDSGDYLENIRSLELKNNYAYLYKKQVDWVEQTCQNEGKGNEALIFLHIPLVEYKQATITAGECNENICSSEINSGLFQVLYEKDLAVSVFCGHDHDNDFAGNFMGINLNYGLIGGYNVYGDFKRGYREITISTKKEIETKLVTYI